ncbi:MAG: TauD/TfdA family dioxygenase [Acidimicrobiaceae bacterium]|nr:TauD/TfdA family dioxygenase [Acidimicrobiaceae bacterium]
MPSIAATPPSPTRTSPTTISRRPATPLEGLQTVHTAEAAASYGRDRADTPMAVHPVIRTHDQSGRRSLYVTRLSRRQLVGWTRTESTPLLKCLFEHSSRPEYQARHRRHTGDLVMWDNRRLLHFAVHDHADDEF